MKDIRILIDKLGPIQNSEIQFKPLMFFTGDSGMGKSYTAFVCYYLIRTLTGDGITEFIKNKINISEQPDGSKEISVNFTLEELRLWINQNVSRYIGYLVGDKAFQCNINYIFNDEAPNIAAHISIDKKNKSYTTCKINNSVQFIFPTDLTEWSLVFTLALNNYFSDTFFDSRGLKSIFLPPARASFIGANFTMQSGMGSVGMYAEFIKDYDYIRTPAFDKQASDQQFYASMMKKLIGGELAVVDGEMYLVMEDSDKKIPISAAASSIKEISPLLLLLQNRSNSKNFSILFEEPEAHVHPTKQSQVMDLIARCVNKEMMFQITTHSDYFLSRLNQLIRLGKLRQKSEELFEAYCKKYEQNKNLYIDPSIVGAYYFKREKGEVHIEQQNTENGVPFTTFSEIVDQQYTTDERIETYFNQLNEWKSNKN